MKQKLTKENVLEKIKSMDLPTIETISNELKTHRQYISVILNSLEAEGVIQYKQLGNNKIWGLRK
jgi:predicted ArsR family transcriptional regulator